MNALKVGTSRVGDFFDFDEKTPEAKAILERNEEGISLTLPWSDSASPYAHWFLGHSPGEGRLLASDEVTSCPSRVLFHDSHGSMLLTGCWTQGFHADLFGPGSGKLWARAVVLDVDEDIDYEHPHALQSEISGLRDWLGVTSWKETVSSDAGQPHLVIESCPAPTIHLGEVDGMQVSLVPSWIKRTRRAGDDQVLLDLLRCTTTNDKPRSWNSHLVIHQALRDLLVLSRWRNESQIVVTVSRHDDLVKTMDGTTHGRQWRKVVVAHDEPTPPPRGYRPHLIRYEDLGPEGIRRWIDLRRRFGRALDPVLSSIELDHAGPLTVLAHTAPGIEALGYLLALRDGHSAGRAKVEPLVPRLDRILRETSKVLPFDADAWRSTFASTYNGLKHANRAEPDVVQVLNAWSQAVIVVRAWVALELGVDRDEVKIRLGNDGQAKRWIPRT